MKYLKNYEKYNEDLILEKLDLGILIDRFKKSTNKKSIAKLLIGILLASFTVNQTIDYINKNFKDDEKKILVEIVSKFVDPLSLSVSDSLISHIKTHEKLRLKAYKIGDGKITIGYGHAESISKSAFKIGQIITEELADELLKNDIKNAEDGIKRMFKQWKDEGVDIKITQGQYDALVSMVFNMGITGLRNTEFIEHFKNGNLNVASELIKTTKINDKKFPGLRKRRIDEYNMFIS